MDLEFIKTSGNDLNDLIIKSKEEMDWNIKKTNNFYSICRNGETLGFLSIETEWGFMLHHIYLLPEFRRCGYGSEVMNYLVNKYEKVRIDTPNYALVNLLIKLGYCGYSKESSVVNCNISKVMFFTHDITYVSSELGDNIFLGTPYLWIAPDNLCFLVYVVIDGVALFCTDTRITSKFTKINKKREFEKIIFKYRNLFKQAVNEDIALQLMFFRSNLRFFSIYKKYPLFFGMDTVKNSKKFGIDDFKHLILDDILINSGYTDKLGLDLDSKIEFVEEVVPNVL